MKETNNQAFIDGQNLAISTKCAKTPWAIVLSRLSSLYRLQMPDSYCMYLDDSSTKRKIILKRRMKQSKNNDGDKTK